MGPGGNSCALLNSGTSFSFNVRRSSGIESSGATSRDMVVVAEGEFGR